MINFAAVAVWNWLEAALKEELANRGMDELKDRQEVVTPHRTIDTLIGQQQHLLRKAHAAAAIAAVVDQKLDSTELQDLIDRWASARNEER